MRLWIGVTALAAAFLGAPFLVERASATPVEASHRYDTHLGADRVTDISARHRYRHHSYYHRHGYARRYRAALPYDGYRPYYLNHIATGLIRCRSSAEVGSFEAYLAAIGALIRRPIPESPSQHRCRETRFRRARGRAYRT